MSSLLFSQPLALCEMWKGSTTWSRITFSRDRAISHTRQNLGKGQVVGDEWVLLLRGGSRAPAVSRVDGDIHRIAYREKEIRIDNSRNFSNNAERQVVRPLERNPHLRQTVE